MPFTTRTVTHTFLNADGTAASGKATFDLSTRITNNGTTIIPVEITATLDGTGAISVLLAANDDAGTTPADSQWRVTLRILGASDETFFITVPSSGTGNVDLGELLPASPQVA